MERLVELTIFISVVWLRFVKRVAVEKYVCLLLRRFFFSLLRKEAHRKSLCLTACPLSFWLFWVEISNNDWQGRTMTDDNKKPLVFKKYIYPSPLLFFRFILAQEIRSKRFRCWHGWLYHCFKTGRGTGTRQGTSRYHVTGYQSSISLGRIN